MATPTVKKLLLGNELRHLRDAAGLSQLELGRAIEKSQPKIASLEAGQASITRGDLLLLLDALGVTDQERINFFLDLRGGHGQHGRWTGYRRLYREQMRMYIDLEEDAKRIRVMESEVMPGLLQCKAYAEAMFTDWDASADNAEFDDWLRARLERQKILDREDKPAELEVVVSESSLRREFGGPAVMREQLAHLIERSKAPNVQVQVLPFKTGHYRGASVTFPRFTMFRIDSPGVAGPLEIAYNECPDARRYVDDKEGFAVHDRLWSRLTAAALSPEATRLFMRDVLRDYQ